MATNFIQNGEVLTLSIADVMTGDPVAVGEIVGVALTDTNDDGIVEVMTRGVWNLSVTASDGTNDAAIAVGDGLYFDGETINKNTAETKFGKALGAVAAGGTAIIPVLIG